MRHVGQACREPEPFVHFVSDLHLGVTKVTMELRWLSVLKMVSSIMLCCLCFCFITLMNFPCVGRRKKKYLPHFIPLSTQSEFMSVSAKISSFNEKKSLYLVKSLYKTRSLVNLYSLLSAATFQRLLTSKVAYQPVKLPALT